MNIRRWSVAAGAVGAGVVALGFGTLVAGLLREVFRAERAVDDGPDELLEQPTDLERGTVTSIDGTRLNVVTQRGSNDSDDSPIIVAVHGWVCNTSYWNPQFNHFAGTPTTVVAYDQRGHGGSELGRARPSVAMLGQDLDAVLEAVVPQGRKAILIGHSMGGMTIMSWAAQFPDKIADKVASVVLCSTAAKAVLENHQLVPLNLPRYTNPFRPTLSKIVVGTPMPLPHTAQSKLFAHYFSLGPYARAAQVDFVDSMVTSCPPRARAGWGSAMGKLDVVSGLAALSVPTTIVTGTVDRLTPASHAEQMASVLRETGNLRDLVIFDDVGHMSTIEAAGSVNELLDDIVESVSTERVAATN